MKRSRSWVNVVGTVSLVLFTLNGNTVRATSDYVVRADDKLKIKIFQYPELSGEYKVRANGTISIAPITDAFEPVPRMPTVNSGPLANSSTRTGSR